MGKKQQTSSVLPHLPHGMNMPHTQITRDRPMMPGQKALPSDDWKNTENNQLVPGIDRNVSRQRSVVSRHGIPWTDRTPNLQLTTNAEPPPIFSSTPSKISALRNARESKTQKQIQRMDSGIDPVELLITRLESWRLAIKNLVSLFKKIALVENKTSKGLVGASQTIELPFKDSFGQFLESGGIQDIWASLRDYTMQHGILHNDTGNFIESTVLPGLRAIKGDIKTMIAQIEKDRSLKTSIIYDSRMNVNRLITQLDKTIEADQRSPRAADHLQDPFLINLSVIYAIRELCDHENRLHDNILNLQQETGLFEQKVIENIRHIIQNYHDFRVENKIEDESFIGNVMETFRQLSPVTEWNNFVQRNKNHLVMENSVYKTEDSVEYPNQKNRFVRASKIGPLQTKTGITRGWTEGIYILTPAGFLHGYKTPKHFETNPLNPSFSIFVPNSTVSSDGDTFEINCNKDKYINLGAHNYVFRAPTRDDNMAWYSYLHGITEEFKVIPLLEKTESNYSSTPLHRDLPPLPSSVLPVESGQERRAIEGAPPPTQGVNLNQQRAQPGNTLTQQQRGTPQYGNANDYNNIQQQNTGHDQYDNTGHDQYDNTAYNQQDNYNQRGDYNEQDNNNEQNRYNEQYDNNGYNHLDNTNYNRQDTNPNTITGDNQLANISAHSQGTTTNDYPSTHQGNNFNTGQQENDYRHASNHELNQEPTYTNQAGDYASGSQTGTYTSARQSENQSVGNNLAVTNDNNNAYTPGDPESGIHRATHDESGYDSSGKYNRSNENFNSADNFTSAEDLDKHDHDRFLPVGKSPIQMTDGEYLDPSSTNDPHYEEVSTHQSNVRDDSFNRSRQGYTSNKQGGPGM
ncbi:hypothetical protein BD770DRAFT_440876 [Pilaira anomala]|nr:hypothetical protein BD770DRAFT_440876 [Pilaira anomala]